MSTPGSKPAAAVDDLLAELDAEFGKKKSQTYKSLNRAFPRVEGGAAYTAKAQLERMQFRNYYDWERHKQQIEEVEQKERGEEDILEWTPECSVSFVVRQTCACCHNVTEFIGNEYIRFRGRRRIFHELGGGEHEMQPTVLRQISQCDPNLVMYGLPNGDPLPSFIEEVAETVRRCVGCVMVEQRALDLWIATTQPRVQDELPLDEI